VPPAAQQGLKEALRLQGLFLACQCQPSEDIELERYGSSAVFDSRVERVEWLGERVLRVYLTAPAGFVYQAGQFIQLERPGDGVSRAYSIASLPGAALELHVALLPGGAMSQWARVARILAALHDNGQADQDDVALRLITAGRDELPVGRNDSFGAS